FGKGITSGTAELCYGIKPITDPRLTKGDFHTDTLPFDPTGFHLYAAVWTPDGVAFFLDNQPLKSVSQSPDYPMQFMMGVYALPLSTRAPVPRKLPRFTIDYFRGYQRDS
ncbi:MAG: glycoside hydrolase family 16 protein, partial [Hyphomicrobiales bacterium]|nr:glycoside hydrolase family 16 protein [Hyphomicrobiales bacterium]